MEIGNPQRIYTIEPVEDPVPAALPEQPDESPVKQRPAPVEEPVPS